MTRSPTPTPPSTSDDVSLGPLSTRRVAAAGIVSGVIAVCAAILVPLLPVQTSTTDITWPQGQELSDDNASVTAPLVAQSAQDLSIHLPCEALATAGTDERTTVLSTMPVGTSLARQNALTITADPDNVLVTNGGDVLAAAPREEMVGCEALRIWSTPTETAAEFVGLAPPAFAEEGHRPQISGVFTGLSTEQVRAAESAGLAVDIAVDNRFDSSPTTIKLLAIIIGILAVLISLAALAILDHRFGYHRRIGRARWLAQLKPRVTDMAVTATLVIWHFLGAGASDDGYVLNMGRNAEHAGYLANYYRYYGIPEAPFDWYYEFLAHWSTISASGIWMRLPSLLAGLLSWFILSRVLLPRLGHAVRSSQWAMVSGAAVFLAFWLPMASGLRSEGIIVLGTLLTWWAVEQTVATRRILPAAAAALAAGFTVALAPHGIIAVAMLFVGARAMLAILVHRRREVGVLPLLAPLLAAPALVVLLVFRDQTLATIAEALSVRASVGPTLAWYQEFLRFYFLVVSTQDGSLVRRVPVLLLVVSLFVVLAILLRRKRIPGIDVSALWRVCGATLITVLLLSFAPTKWTTQFGIYAGFGAALAAAACVVIAQAARRTTRNLSILVAGLLVACAAAAAGDNAWPWPQEFGIAFFDKAPVIAGYSVSTLLLGLAVVALAVALWQHLRIDYVADAGLDHAGTETPRWRVAIASAPIAVIAVTLLLSQLGLFAKAAVDRSDTYTVLAGNLGSLTGHTCGMADSVLVEPNPNEGMLTPVDGDATATLEGTSTGFDPNGVGDDLTPEPTSIRPGTMHTSGDLSTIFIVTGSNPGTIGGVGPEGVNGSTAALPYGLDPQTTPVMGSYGPQGQASLTTGWYELPARDASPLITITAAGAIFSADADGIGRFGQPLEVQFGIEQGGEFTQVGESVVPIDADYGNRPWRNLRIPMTDVPDQATAMRITAIDNNLDPDQWLAITPPRAPVLQTLQEVVGGTDPVLIDFAAGASFPCQQPMQTRDGISQVPQWRILPDPETANAKSRTWMSARGGGPLATVESLTAPSTMATYLRNDWFRDWGNLQRLRPLIAEAQPASTTNGTARQWGWSRPGPMQVESQND